MRETASILTPVGLDLYGRIDSRQPLVELKRNSLTFTVDALGGLEILRSSNLVLSKPFHAQNQVVRQ